MDESTKRFLEKNFIPEHVCLLLELYGVVFIQDLINLKEADVQEIEENVRDGGFDSQVNFELESSRIKYLGFNMANVKKFVFRPMDRKKLLALKLKKNNKADSEEDSKEDVKIQFPMFEEIHIKSEPSSTTFDQSDEDFSINGVTFNDQVDSIFYAEVPKKKKKMKRSAHELKQLQSKFATKTINSVNICLEAQGYEETIDKNQITVAFNDVNQKFMAKAKCVVCYRMVSLGTTTSSVSAANYRKHLMALHSAKTENVLEVIKCSDYVFMDVNGSVQLCQVLGFKYLSGKERFKGLTCPVDYSDDSGREVAVLVNIFDSNKRLLTPSSERNQEFINLKNYKSHGFVKRTLKRKLLMLQM